MDVVAFVRNAKKLERALYDEEDLVLENLMDNKNRGSGPKLQVVVSNVVSPRDLHQGNFKKEDEEKKSTTLNLWAETAKRYFTTIPTNETNNNPSIIIPNSFGRDTNETSIINDIHILESGIEVEEALRNAIMGSSILISCLATFRPSNIWIDYLRVPIVRVFRKDASRWSNDVRHPYYVNYLSTKKILEEAEMEQRRREVVVRSAEEERRVLEERKRLKKKSGRRRKEEEGFESEIAERLAQMRKKRRADGSRGNQNSNNYNGEDSSTVVQLPKKGRLPSSTDRIKFIRISLLIVGCNPFRPWNIMTNIL